jgi:thiamine biosynthesis lipoprotein
MIMTAPYRLIEERGQVMACATSVHIAVATAHEAEAQMAATACFAWLREVEACLTRFDLTSELCQLNRAAGAWFTASATLFAVTQAALVAAAATDGLFDPTLLEQIVALGYDRDYAHIAHQAVAKAAHPLAKGRLGRWREVELDATKQRIRLPHGVGLDVGGIAKGWAADEALARFCAPFPGAIVSLGGDLRLRGGPQPGTPWPVGIHDPHRSRTGEPEVYRAIITLDAGGIATSGATDRWWLQNGVPRHHLLDPRTGQPADLWLGPDLTPNAGQQVAMVTALAATATAAEVATKVALLRPEAPLPTTLPLWQEDDPTVALFVLRGDGQVRTSENFTEYLARRGGGRIWFTS